MSRRGFMLIDAVVGLALLALLISGLHELRVAQARSVKTARARLAATETAAAAALLASLTPGVAPDAAKRDALCRELRPGVSLSVEPVPATSGVPALLRVTARAAWSTARTKGVEEVAAVALP